MSSIRVNQMQLILQVEHEFARSSDRVATQSPAPIESLKNSPKRVILDMKTHFSTSRGRLAAEELNRVVGRLVESKRIEGHRL